jgi:membrane protease YdiL (CAAX protease family)
VVASIALSCAFVLSAYRSAFPQASLDLKLDAAQVRARAEAYLAGRGLSTAKFRNITVFDPDDDSRLFLERQAGLEEANRLMRSDVAVWRWRSRWYRPPDKEEMRVWLAPDGRVVGFEHVVAESAGGARIEPDKAREIATAFLESHTKLPHKLVEQSREQRPNRDDHTFTWEQEGFRLHDATYRRTVTIHGDRPDYFLEYLHVPEQWQRDFAAMRSKNDIYSQIAQVFYLPLFVAAVVVLIQALRRRDVRWSPLVAISLAVACMMAANQLNLIPLTLDGMPTSSTITTSLGIAILTALGAGAFIFFYVLAAGAPGETLYRRMLPDKLTIAQLFSRQGVQSREFFWACVSGYGFAAAHLAFLVAFYLVSKNLGAWSPQDVQYSNLLSTALPWMYPLSISLLASLSEEFWFRLLAIPLLKRLTGSTVVAVLVPAFVWGFLHANYPQQPAYIRGVEVGLIGVGAGLLMLGRGILATLVWHYTVDAALIGTFLVASPSWYFRLSGAAVALAVLMPLAVSIACYVRNGGFLVVDRLPEAEPAPPPGEEAAGAATVEAMSRWPRKWLVAAAVVLLAAGLALRARPMGSFAKVGVDRAGALRLAGDPPPGWLAVADFVPNLSVPTFEYLRRHVGPAEADRLVQRHTLAALWRVRWYRDQSPEAYYRFIDSSGKVFRIDHDLDEKAAGAKLELAQAREIAERYLRDRQGIDPTRLKLVEGSSEKLDNRVDHSFEWEDPQLRVGEAKARILLDVLGDEPGRFRPYIKLPEEWEREFSRPRIQRFLLPALLGGFALTLLFVFLRNLGGANIAWRKHGLLVGVAFCLSLAGFVNGLPSLNAAYDSAKPLAAFTSDAYLGALMRAVVMALAVGLGSVALAALRRMAGWPARLAPPEWIDVAAICAALAGAVMVSEGVERLVPGDRLHLSLWSIAGMGAAVPALAPVLASASFALVATLGVGLAFAGAAVVLSPTRQLVYASMLAVVAALAGALTVPLFVAEMLGAALLIAVGVLAIRCTGAGLLSVAAAMFAIRLVPEVAAMAEQPAESVRLQGVAAALVGLALLVAFLFAMRRRYSHAG